MPLKDVTEEFCGNPEAFMNNNIVLVSFIDPLTPAGLQYFTCWQGGAAISNKPNGKVCILKVASEKTRPALPVYWCPYVQYKAISTMLGNEALFAFTATMDGCSVGLGSSNAGNQAFVHVNAAQIATEWESEGADVARARQEASQHAQLMHSHDCTTIVNPSDYRPQNLRSSTTFAVHGLGQAWTIKTLTYARSNATNYEHHGVTSY